MLLANEGHTEDHQEKKCTYDEDSDYEEGSCSQKVLEEDRQSQDSVQEKRGHEEKCNWQDDSAAPTKSGKLECMPSSRSTLRPNLLQPAIMEVNEDLLGGSNTARGLS